MSGFHNVGRCHNHSSVRSAMCGYAPDMSPRWGWEYYFGVGFYKHVAPLGLGLGVAVACYTHVAPLALGEDEVYQVSLAKLDTLFAFLQHRAFRGEL